MRPAYGTLDAATQPMKYPATMGTKMAKAHTLTGSTPPTGPPSRGTAPPGFVAAGGASSASGAEGAAAAGAGAAPPLPAAAVHKSEGAVPTAAGIF